MEATLPQSRHRSKRVPVFASEREGKIDPSTHLCVNIKNSEKIEYFEQHGLRIGNADSGFTSGGLFLNSILLWVRCVRSSVLWNKWIR